MNKHKKISISWRRSLGEVFISGMLDVARQEFYEKALAAVKSEDSAAFVVILGLGSVLPMLKAAKFSGMLLETSQKLAELAQQLLIGNKAQEGFKVSVVKAFDDEDSLQEVLQSHLPKNCKTIVVLTERMAHDLLSNGIVPCCITSHKALKKLRPSSKILHLPQTVELLVSPGEIRSERLKDFDIRPFNALRHTSSNDKADFWWWPVRGLAQISFPLQEISSYLLFIQLLKPVLLNVSFIDVALFSLELLRYG